ncbi:Mitochondrial intermembrane space import and assembly protein 40 [Cyphellophora attinorum]|uniref:Mitochondrial intermembrane space import and assembly protein 40 n=1 Tax=Cyphellophora attinorum TaxID=1664694 RepID=A0A0N0NHZ3_9EURO|nr:Mitochondrial intermembrane space import and assembly protein 40 [Phialophora attinorum]KPI34849.1 Mitochondrial intermembrane space import and assembly protein 40 [Phialophora attinorum]
MMFRTTARAASRTAGTASHNVKAHSFRSLSTQPPHLRSRSWKSSAVRWGIALAGLYYYNTSSVFAEQPHHNLLNPNVDSEDESEAASVLDELTSRRSREAQKNHAEAQINATVDQLEEPALAGGAAELEEEAAGEGAFNPETGEINWDCPCLGGMAHGPCGPQFREAFSCFVYSTEEPKGMDCIEKFQGMRDCFQEHPDVYKDELMEDEELDRELEAEKQELVSQIAERRRSEENGSAHNLLEEPAPAPQASSKAPAPAPKASSKAPASSSQTAPKAPSADVSKRATQSSNENISESSQRDPSQRDPSARADKNSSSTIRVPNPPPVDSDAIPETDELIPKAAHDARTNTGSASVQK